MAQKWRWRTNALTRAAILVAGLIAIIALTRADHASAAIDYDCSGTGSPQGPYHFDTWEAGDYKTRYSAAFDLAGTNQLFPNSSFALPQFETGDRSSGSGTTVAPYIPPVLLKAISYIESGWAQASYDPLVQYGQTGATLVSADCGYGLMQVTSGMQNVSGTPSLDQALVGGNYAYNIAKGAQILASKWNEGPELRPVMGNRDPHIIENWYYPLWAYNGFAFRNHPLNPGYDPNRPPYDCQGDTPRDYPYQELILGCVAHPPIRDGVPLWEAQPVTLPNLTDPIYSGPLDVNNWNPCSFELNCAPMDIPTPTDAHPVATTPAIDSATLLGTPALSADQLSLDMSSDTGTAQATLTIANDGTGLGTWRARTDQSWLGVSGVEGISQGTDIGSYSTPLTVTAHLGAATDGDHHANLIVDAPGGVDWVIPVTVHLHRVGCDDTLTTADVLAVLNQESGVGGCIADVKDTNCDGMIDSRDIVAVMRFLIGLPVPACGAQ